MILSKSIHSAVDPELDGLRILVARYRGRGMDKSRYDVWMASMGPSEELLRQFQDGDVGWNDFSRRFKEEIFTDGDVDDFNATIKNHGQKFTLRLLQELGRIQNVTLLCHCPESEEHCHRHLLVKMLASAGL